MSTAARAFIAAHVHERDTLEATLDAFVAERTAALRTFIQELVDEAERLPYNIMLLSQEGRMMLEKARALAAGDEPPQ